MKTFTGEQVVKLRKIWKEVKSAEGVYWGLIDLLEKEAKATVGVEVEVFHCDGGAVGLGDFNREYKLLQSEDLE